LTSPDRILLVDDEAPFRFAAVVALRKAGYRIETAADGREAMEKVLLAGSSGDPFRLVITDIRMPEMSGTELIDAIRKNGGGPAVCAITCFGDRALIDELARKGCTEFLEKPFPPEELAGWISRILSSARE
jgi:DNA-binding NtrC family response regulator